MKDYHDTRLPYDHKREVLWRALCNGFFQSLIGPRDCVLELGAGYAHFINNICCGERISVSSA